MKHLKILSIFIVVMGFFSGCAPTQSVLNLDAYSPSALKPASNKQVFISKVEDTRASKSVIATITDSDGSVSEYVVLQNDLNKWFNEALITELRANGAIVSQEDNAVSVELYISEFSASMSGYGKDNTKGKIALILKIRRGDETITKNISNEQTKFSLIHTSGAFKPFLNEIAADAIRRAVAQIMAL